MQKLLSSRTRRDEQLISVGNISPEKYGKSAYCNLHYTPSKLVDHVLYKQVSTLKKIQEQSSKTRQFQAINDCLIDKLKYMQQQKNVIINSLNQQITVYKKIINQMGTKNQDRIKQLQKKFKQQLSKIISNKQEQAKFIQSQKQILQERIQQLQKINSQLQQKINSHQQSVSDIKSGKQRLEKQVENLNYRIKQKNQQIKDIQQRNRIQVENLHRKLLETQMTWKQQLKQALNRKQIEIQAIQSSHNQQVQKLTELRLIESDSFKKQTNQIIHSYEKQLKKLSDLIVSKQKTIDTLVKDHKEQKSKNLLLTKNYQSELNQLNNLKLLVSELQKQNDKLRDLLLESSRELERCREEFLIIDRENNNLKIRIKSSDQEAKTWRESYYQLSRR